MKVLIRKTRVAGKQVFVLVHPGETYIDPRGQLTSLESEAKSFESVEAASGLAKHLNLEAERPDTWWWLRTPLFLSILVVIIYWVLTVVSPGRLPWRWGTAALFFGMFASLAPAVKLMDHWGDQGRDILMILPPLAWMVIFAGGAYLWIFVLRLPPP